MTFEIERKHLVVGDGWRAAALNSQRLIQGYLAKTDRLTLRVRIADSAVATLTAKGPRRGIVREEIEVPISITDARWLLSRCSGRLIEKVRHKVDDHGQIWTVDEFIRPARGLLLAEIELERPDQAYALPAWAGAEVTQAPQYRNSNLAGAGLRRGARSAERDLQRQLGLEPGLSPDGRDTPDVEAGRPRA
jgi:adenylate cyclase